jgi:Flp pilus assembly protein TadG
MPILRSNRKNRKGTSILELALISPLLLLMVAGAADFGRVFYHAITLANAAGTGAFYGAQSPIKSTDYKGIREVAQSDAADLGAIDVNTNLFCNCPDGTQVDCLVGSCPGYGAPRVYVKTQTSESFRPMVRCPGIPNPVKVGRTAYLRVQ